MPPRSAYAVSNGLAPSMGPLSIFIQLDFTARISQTIDLDQEMQNGIIDMVQSAYVDNSTNPQPLIIFIPVTQYRIVIPPFAQATIPIIGPDKISIVFSVNFGSNSLSKPSITLMNVPLPIAVWNSQNIGNSFRTNAVTITAGTTSATPNTASNALASNIARRSLMVENLDPAVDLWVGTVGTITADNSSAAIAISPKEKYDMFSQVVYTGNVFVVSTAISHPYKIIWTS